MSYEYFDVAIKLNDDLLWMISASNIQLFEKHIHAMQFFLHTLLINDRSPENQIHELQFDCCQNFWSLEMGSAKNEKYFGDMNFELQQDSFWLTKIVWGMSGQGW
jgi:hypothetical protein